MLVALVALIATGLRLFRITSPGRLVGDEGFYVRDACWYVMPGNDACRVTEEITREHPPLGKWLIGLGIEAFGYGPLGWRIAAAVVGAIGVVLTYVLARRLLRSTLSATVAALLVTFDLLHFVQSRISMLDIFVSTFVLAGFLLWVLDGERDRAAVVGQRPWLLVAGILLGAATATKWSAAWVWFGLAAATVYRDLRGGRGSKLRARLRRHAPAWFFAFVLFPAATYVATYIGRIGGGVISAPWARGSLVRNWVGLQVKGMLAYHLDLEGVHPDMSPAWSWPLVKRPMAYLFDVGQDGIREILAIGNPLLWGLGIIAAVYLLVRPLRAPVRFADVCILLGLGLTYLPWLLVSQTRSFSFIFYFLPAVPFVYLALARLMSDLGRGRYAVNALAVVLAAGVFAFFYPLLVGNPVTRPELERRLVARDCGGAPTRFEIRRLIEEASSSLLEDPEARLAASLQRLPPPPTGWCWR